MTKPIYKSFSHNIHKVNECPHYCSVGGHFWTHPTERGKNGIAACSWRMNDTQTHRSVVKFFSVCHRHRTPIRRKTSWDGTGEDYE